jgi:hypothetical protein
MNSQVSSTFLNRARALISHLHASSPAHASAPDYERPFRTLHTGTLGGDESVPLPVQRPSRLDLRRSYFDANPSVPFPVTTIAILSHLFRIANEVRALHVHLKYVFKSGECIVMFRTASGLVRYSTITNHHWIPYLVAHAAKSESLETVEEGEHRLEIVADNGVHAEFTCGILHLHDGIKITLTPIV